MLEEKRKNFKKVQERVGKIFSKIGFSPNQYTLISLFFVFFSFFFLIKKNLIFAFIFFAAASLLDFIDGAVAKFLKTETKRGAYLDTICDRYVEGIILFGFLFLPLKDFIFPAKFWIFLALFGSLMTTYSKSAAKEKELIKKELKRGFLGRAERIILILSAIFLGIFDLSLMIYPISVLAIFSNLTVFQRIYFSLKFGENTF